jgi:molybdopterin-guanine dinucleotide biosynthesis protein A
MIDAVILAGGVPQKEDLLYTYTQGRPKALLDVAGKPMGQWVLDALTRAPGIGGIIVVGLEEGKGLASSKVHTYLADRGSMLGNALAGLDCVLSANPQAEQVLMVGCDIPLLTSEMVEAMLALADDPGVDIYHSLVARATMEARFPDSRRSYARFADGHFAAGDIHVVAPHIGHAHRNLWQGLMDGRKHIAKQALHLGPLFLTRYLSGRLTIAELEARVQRKFGLNARAVEVEYAEMGMDCDKPFQLEICRRELAQGVVV